MRFTGNIGFGSEVETEPSVWESFVVERKYKCTLIKDSFRNSKGEGVNNNLTLSNRVSLVGDIYANENYFNIKYINMHKVNWEVSDVEINYPNLILTIGGVYNGLTP